MITYTASESKYISIKGHKTELLNKEDGMEMASNRSNLSSFFFSLKA